MAATMRLMRFGGKKMPFYRIVVADSRFPRDGGFIEQVGTHHPRKEPAEVRIKEDRAVRWLKEGVKPSPTVKQLLIRSGVTKRLSEAVKA